jgi:hypothetical protein
VSEPNFYQAAMAAAVGASSDGHGNVSCSSLLVDTLVTDG